MVASPRDVVHRRLRTQRLAGRPFASPVAAVRALAAVQGQELPDAKWAIGRRVRGATEASVQAALDSGALVRTHALRPTWHVLAAGDVRWIQRATAAGVHRRMAPNRAAVGLDAATLARSNDALAAGLAGGGALTRTELADLLRGAGIEASGQRLAYLVMHAELEVVICSGPRRGRQHTYVLADQRLPPDTAPLPAAAARAELAARYFAGHGPATARDFAWWSSLRAPEVAAAIEAAGDRLERATDAGGTPWWAGPGGHARTRRPSGALLLSQFDEAIIAFRDLRLVPPAPPPRGAVPANPVLIDGATAGAWRRTLGRTARLDVEPTGPLGAGERAALEAEAARFAAFHALPLELRC